MCNTQWIFKLHVATIKIISLCCEVSLENFLFPQLVKKFTAFHGTQRFFTQFVRARQLSLSWNRPVQPMQSQPISLRFSIILSFHPSLVLPSWGFPAGFSTETHYTTLFSPARAACPAHFPSSWFHHPDNIWWGAQSCNSSLHNFLQPNSSLDWTILTAMLHEDPQAILYTSGA